MIDKLRHITINEVEYPFAYSLNVMESVQEKYGSMEAWGKKIQPEEGQEPCIKDLIWTFEQFINEGIEIENDEKCENRKPVTHKQAGRLITYFGQKDVANIISDTVINSVNIEAGNDNDEKN